MPKKKLHKMTRAKQIPKAICFVMEDIEKSQRYLYAKSKLSRKKLTPQIPRFGLISKIVRLDEYDGCIRSLGQAKFRRMPCFEVIKEILMYQNSSV
ncbi:unnamed protein product [Sphenostylis stenocarpa]|uniref:Uncharacterized protein n=1 Tax=Sphenostylis stenocarpa TaxID=92480 RepID=A0AA86W396_9FABA|nr:unnamed protein product [Sphenostylis stenocarpa]